MSGTFSGSVTIAYTLSVVPTTILQSGTIAVAAGGAIYGGAAGTWSVLNAGLVQGAAYGTPAGTGVSLGGAGVVNNSAGGTITGGRGAVAIIGAGGVYNAGVLSATGYGSASGSVVAINTAGASVTNAATGLISGGQLGVFIGGNPKPSTVVNQGHIVGAAQAGVFIGGGYILNAAGGVISAGDLAIAFSYTGIVVNAGTLEATMPTGDAVDFATDYGNRLVVFPGAVFIGVVNGGHTAGSTSSSTLELRSGSSAGTLTGLGTQFTNFSLISVDAGANWGLTGSAVGEIAVLLQAGAAITLAAGGALASTDGSAGAVVEAPNGGTLENYGSIGGVGKTGVQLHGGLATNAAGGTIAGQYDGLDLDASPGTLVNAGSIVGTVANGVLLQGGSASNAGSGVIIGGVDGVLAQAGASTLTNAGSIGQTGTLGSGVGFYAGGIVTNLGGGTVSGQAGVYINGGTGLVSNAGEIIGAGGSNSTGVALLAGGSVVNAAGGTIGGYRSGAYIHDAATVTNAGGIAGSEGDGVYLNGGGSVSNAAAGSISGGKVGINISGGVGTVVNDGSIGGVSYSGVALSSGGSVTNAAAASIVGGGVGVYVGGAPGVVVNEGGIGGGATGVYLRGGGTLSNAASASISGSVGAYLVLGGTIVNGGTIVGSGGAAVEFGGTVDNRLVLEPGYGVSGLVRGSASAGNVLELASAASAGVVVGLGTGFVNFGSIVFDASAQWSITGDTVGLRGTISSFAVGDTIEVSGVTVSDPGFADGILTLDAATGATLDLPGNFTIGSFELTPNADGTEVTLVPPCFAAGARLLTASGEVAVEALAVGDLVVTRPGRLRPVKWIGWRRIEPARHARPWDVRPVRIRENAFGVGVPHRVLRLSPDHAVYWQGVLIPVRCLCNGTTIRQEAVLAVDYYHVELDAHDVVLAEGLAAESYLDTGNRCAFANNGDAVQVHPDFSAWAWEAVACAPLVVLGPVVEAARQCLAQHAVALAGSRLQGARKGR